MAAYVQFTNRESGEVESFIHIDERLCKHFGQPVDDKKYLCHWYDTIAFRAALDESLADIHVECQNYKDDNCDVAITAIAQYLALYYTTKSWSGR